MLVSEILPVKVPRLWATSRGDQDASVFSAAVVTGAKKSNARNADRFPRIAERGSRNQASGMEPLSRR